MFNKNFYSREYDYNVTLVKNYNNLFVKFIRMNCCRVSGIDKKYNYVRKNSVNNSKLYCNKLRAKNRILEYSLCNNWDWFFTGTLNPKKFDRSNLNFLHKNITQWFNNYNKKHKTNIKFLLVPELHKDKINWHLHGLISGLPVEHLQQFKIGDVMGSNLAQKVKNGDVVYNWLAYNRKFGFCDLEPIKNHTAIGVYMTKYVTKNLMNDSSIELGGHMYYHSRGLKKADTIKKGHMIWENIQPHYSNDFCDILNVDFIDKDIFLNKFIC